MLMDFESYCRQPLIQQCPPSASFLAGNLPWEPVALPLELTADYAALLTTVATTLGIILVFGIMFPLWPAPIINQLASDENDDEVLYALRDWYFKMDTLGVPSPVPRRASAQHINNNGNPNRASQSTFLAWRNTPPKLASRCRIAMHFNARDIPWGIIAILHLPQASQVHQTLSDGLFSSKCSQMSTTMMQRFAVLELPSVGKGLTAAP
ncbi:hypothetical protein DFH27DRAFT_614713 [Peziza echinospora]|nr:hypothetical protein DFH27DRAFT_614713 [Peziza echinospora]